MVISVTAWLTTLTLRNNLQIILISRNQKGEKGTFKLFCHLLRVTEANMYYFSRLVSSLFNVRNVCERKQQFPLAIECLMHF